MVWCFISVLTAFVLFCLLDVLTAFHFFAGTVFTPLSANHNVHKKTKINLPPFFNHFVVCCLYELRLWKLDYSISYPSLIYIFTISLTSVVV